MHGRLLARSHAAAGGACRALPCPSAMHACRLQARGFGQHAASFARGEVDEEVLHHLTDEDLQVWGYGCGGARVQSRLTVQLHVHVCGAAVA